MGGVLELPVKQHCQSCPFMYLKTGPHWPNWQCCLAGLQNGSQEFDFFNCLGCQIFILCAIHCYFCPHIFWVYYSCLSHCGPFVKKKKVIVLSKLTKIYSQNRIIYFYYSLIFLVQTKAESVKWLLPFTKSFETGCVE